MADANSGVSVMSDASGVFRPFEKLVEITINGKPFLVPERNSVLRAFQYISPGTIPYGKFCWSQDCQFCKADCQLPDEAQPRSIQTCQFMVSEGIRLTNLSPELVACLKGRLEQP